MNNNNQKWFDYIYQFEKHINFINLSLISLFINKFYNEVLINLNKNQVLFIIFKIKTTSDNVYSISYLQTIKIRDYKNLIDIFSEYWGYKSENYNQLVIKELNFTYKNLTLDQSKEITIKDHSTFKNFNEEYKFGGYNLPNTMDFTEWGEIKYISDNYVIVNKPNTNLKYQINIFDKYMNVSLRSNNIVLLDFIDYIEGSCELNNFTRIINNKQTYIFENGELKLKSTKKHVKFLTKIDKSILKSNNFITMDLETREENIDGIRTMKPYCICMFDGSEEIKFYLLDYLSSDDMLEASIRYLMKRKYHNYKIYFHNFSYFDGIFIMKILSKLSNNIDPIIRDGRLIDIRFKYKVENSNYVLYFRDSYLILTSSLKKLTKSFGVENKGLFPYKFVNDSKTNLDYIGDVPNFNYFDNIKLEEYNEYLKNYINKKWDLREETLKYCIQDCISLYQVIEKFNDKIFKLYRLDIHKYPTLSSLGFGLYRSNFLDLNKHKIPLIHGKIYDFIQRSYTGGSVDLFKPYGKNVKGYDVNSLYPSSMLLNDMPVGSPTYFEGDIRRVDSKAFGFFEVKVTCPDNINIPILQTRIKFNDSTRTITPVGTWTGVYFSEEIKNAESYGYKFEVLRGYTFERGNLFKEFVESLYILKMNSAKGSPEYAIAKLLLNSLYGRLGMSPYVETHKIVDTEENFNEINEKHQITSVLNFDNCKQLVSFFDLNCNEDKLNISVPISSAVTAYSRIHMSKLKYLIFNLGGTLYYSDTDSIFTELNLEELVPSIIGKELGKLKLENIFKEISFLAPKVYGGITIDNKELVKIKGSKNMIDYKSLNSLLNKDSRLEINQEKWYRNLSKGEIIPKNEIYTLMVTENKRKLIYENNKLVDTLPLKLNNNKIE